MIKRRKKVYIHIYIYISIYINNPNPRIHQTGSRRGTKSKREYCGCGRFLEDHTFFGLLDRWWFKCCYDCLRTKMSVSVFTFALSTTPPPTPQLATHLIKDILQPLLRQRRTLYILSSSQLSRQPLPLFLRYQPRRPPSSVAVHHPLHLLWIIPQIHLRAHYQTRRPGTVM